jgi:hypothetical protein
LYPIAAKKLITKVDPKTHKKVSQRKSPKTGKIIDVFDELLRIPSLINNNHFEIEVLLLELEELRCEDGKGSWRRKGQSIVDRKLITVVDHILFRSSKDFLQVLPENLEQPFNNKVLAKRLNTSVYQARRITYCLRKMKALKVIGRNNDGLQFELSI